MKKILLILSLFVVIITNSFGQSCPANSDPAQSYKWPTHAKWYLGRGQELDFGSAGTGTPTVSAIPGTGIGSAYESCASACDEQGNIIFFTNGRYMWDGTGTPIVVPDNGGRLKTGGESAAGNEGSAVQGVLITKHPLDTNRYYIFTTDDVIGGNNNNITYGFNYYVYTKSTNTVSGATRLGNYRSTEQVNATWHNNGVDVWIVSHESSLGSGNSTYNAYLLGCSGLTTTPVVSSAGFPVENNAGAGGYANERASIEFAEADPTVRNITAAATHHCGQGKWLPGESVAILNFDNLTGTFTHVRDLTDGSVAQSNPYDCEFSPDGSRLYVTFQGDPWSGPLSGRIGYYPVTGGAYVQLASVDPTGYMDIGAIQLGGDGNIYGGGFDRQPWGYINGLTVVSNPNGAATATVGGLAAANGSVGYGVPNMFVPPRDWLDIVDPSPLTECDLPYNFSTNWVCKGGSAELTPLYTKAYSLVSGPAGGSIVDSTGVFNATSAGTYKIAFTICTITDTLEFTVGTCGCIADVKPGPLAICEGTNIMLDSLLNTSSGAGVWTVDSVPTAAGTAATITDNAVDTMFNTAVGTIPGTYKVMFAVTGGGCEDSIYITVNPSPVITVNDSAICAGDPAALFTATSATATGWQWSGTGGSTASTQTTSGTTAGSYFVTVSDSNNCSDTASGILTINALPTVSVNSAVICDGDAAEVFTATSATAAAWQWSGTGGSTATTQATSGNTAGVYFVTVTDANNCTDTASGTLTVNPIPSISVNNATICVGDADATFTATSATATGYVWSGNSTSTASTATGSTPGNYFVQVTDANTCTAQGFGVLTVNQVPTVSVNNNTICAGDGNATFTANSATATGYLWSGNSTSTANTATGTAAGAYTVVVTDVNSCTATATGNLTVTPLPVPAITPIADLCANAAAVSMTGTPSGGGVIGVWTVNGAVNATGTFDPSTAIIGNNTIRYTITDNGCTAFIEATVVVNALKDATLSTHTFAACVLDPDPTFTVAQAGGTWSNAAVSMVGTNATINLSALVAANGGNDVNGLVVTYTQPAPCGDVDQFTISTTSVLDATITQVGPYCENQNGNITLSAVDPGGTWSGSGITDAALGTFDPSIATSAGSPHTITYTIPGNCGDSKTIDIVVDAQPSATISGERDLCINAAAITLAVPVNVASAVGTWTEAPSTSGGFNSGTRAFNPGTATAGTYVLTYSVVNGQCNHSDVATIIVIDTAQITFGPYGPYCKNGTPVQLTENDATTPDTIGVWSGSPGTSYITGGGMFNPAQATVGKNAITHTVGTTCQVFVTDSIEILPVPVVTMPAAMGFCSQDPARLIVGNVEPISVDSIYSVSANCGSCYDAISGMFDPTLAGAANSPHTITLIGGVGTACRDTAETVITVTQAAVLNLTPPPDHCVGEVNALGGSTFTAAITAGSTVGNGSWTVDNGSINSTTGVWSGTTVTAADTVKAIYTFTTQDPQPLGCVTKDSVTMIVNANPIASITRTNEDSCVVYADMFKDGTDYGTSSRAYNTWDLGNGAKDTNEDSAGTTYATSGQKTISLYTTDANSCKDTAYMYIDVYPIPTADFSWSPNPASVLDPRIEFVSTGDAVHNYNWNFTNKGAPQYRNGLFPSTDAVFEVVGDDTIPVTLIVTEYGANGTGCTDTITRNVIIQDIFQLYVPNAFTPGSRSDGLNDTFYPKGRNWDPDNYEFLVLDRWGNLIFKTSSIGVGWDGTVDGWFYSGRVAQNDVYVWKITVKDIYTGKVHKKVGTVTLVQ